MSASNRGSTSSNRNEIKKRSVVTYDHLGNLVTMTLLADLVPEENLKRAVFNINTGDRQINIILHKNQDNVTWRELATEM